MEKMDIFEVIKKRRSVRSYKTVEIEEDKLSQILQAAQIAPSASNRQEWRFVVVKDKIKRSALCKAARNQLFVREAPVVIACCAQTDNHVMTCGQLCYPIDLAIAIDHMTLAAAALDLGTCWIGAFYEDEVKAILEIPSQIRVVALLTLGYSQDNISLSKQRLPLKEIIFSQRWGKAI